MRVGIGIGLNYQRPSSGGAPPALILDSLSAGAAYSTRKLRTAYAGSAIRVRRSSDNVEADIGFSGNALDTAALTAHVGANSGFVVTWYDQSGNGRNVTNTTQANQPRIVNAGTIDVQNTKPSLFFNGTSHHLTNASPFMYAAGANTYMAVLRGAAQTDRRIIAEGNTGATAQIFAPLQSSNTIGANASYFARNDANSPYNSNDLNAANFNTNVFDDTLRAFAVRDTRSLIEGFNNGTKGTDVGFTPSGSYTFNVFSIGALVRTTIGSYFSGSISEIIIFTSALSNADFNTVGASQGGEYGITVNPFLTPLERLALINGTGDGGGSLATEVASSAADYDEPIFIDRAKQARGWVKDFEPYPSANLNSEGALNSLVGGDTTAMFFFCSASNTTGAVDGPITHRGGRFRLTFTGSATVDLFNAGTSVTMIDANTYEFDCDWNGNKWVIFTPITYPIKCTLVRTDLLTSHAAGDIFDPAYLAILPSGGCFRFMAAMGANNSTVVNTSDYPVLASQRWSKLPLAAIKNLCDAKSATPWLCVSHQGSDTYISDLATYFRDNMAGKVRFELSNEIWNFQFVQAGYFAAQATAQWGVSGGTTWLSAAGKRFAQMMAIINGVFVGQTSRVIGVLAGQAAGASLTEAYCDAPQWLISEPGSYVRPSSLAKEVAIAPYINWAGGGATVQGDAIKTQLDISHAAAVAYFKTMFPVSLAQSKTWIDNHVPVASSRGLRLTMYEYNNHYDLYATRDSALYSAGTPVAGALDVFIEATYSQEMSDALDDLRDYFKAQNGSLMSFFVSLGAASLYGTWGGKTHLNHTPLTWTGLLSWHAANTRWWAQ